MIVSKTEAKAAGLKRYFTGLACCHGHVADRYVSNSRCSECALINSNIYRAENHEKVIAARRADYQLNADIHRRRSNEYRLANLEKSKASTDLWRKRNAVKIAEYQRARKEARNESNRRRRKERVRSDPLYGMASVVRASVGRAFHQANYKKDSTAAQLIGCTWPELKRHIEQQFLKGMTWENRGSVWHVDHILPLAGATTKEDLRALCHFTNLRPLWSLDNHIKGGKRLHLI